MFIGVLFNVGTKRLIFLTFFLASMAHSSENLQSFQRCHGRDIEKREYKNYIHCVTIFHIVNVAPYFGRDKILI